MAAIAYRDAAPADLPAIDALFRQSFAETFRHMYDPADLAAFFAKFTAQAWGEELADPDYAFRLAETGGKLVGFAKISSLTLPIEMPRPGLELRQVYVLKPWQGSGVAAVLIEWALAVMRARGAEDAYLSVYAENHRALRFYARHGFEMVGRYDFIVGNQADDELIMRAALIP